MTDRFSDGTPIYGKQVPLTDEEREFFVKEFGSVEGTWDWLSGLDGGNRQYLYFQRCLVSAFRAGQKFREESDRLADLICVGCGARLSIFPPLPLAEWLDRKPSKPETQQELARRIADDIEKRTGP